VIRPARVEDAQTLAALQVRAWRAAYSAYVAAKDLDAAGDVGARAAGWRERLAAGRARTVTLVDERDGRLAGFVSVGPTRDEDTGGDAELYAVYVEPELIGSGVGRALALAGEEELRRRGHTAATLWVFAANTAARHFYERGGWRVDQRPYDPGRWGWAPSVRYRKQLAPAPARPAVLVSVTDHAVERFRQRVAGRLDPRAEIAGRVSEAWAAGRVEPGERATVLVRDLADRDLVFVCRHDAPRGELVVVTLWEEGDAARVPRVFTDALRRDDERPRRD
jgi:GNAT superfamily N-acetyltransferase